MNETPEELEAGKARELAEVLAQGWKEEDLTWVHGERGPSEALLAKLVARFPSKGPTSSDGMCRAVQETSDRVRRGTWLVKGEAMRRRMTEKSASEGASEEPALCAYCRVCGEPLGISRSGATVTISAGGHQHPGHPKSTYDSAGQRNADGLTNEEVLVAAAQKEP